MPIDAEEHRESFSRVQFETYLIGLPWCSDVSLCRGDNGDYVCARVNDCWLAWQACRLAYRVLGYVQRLGEH